NKTIHWEEVNSKTGRIYENHDSLINWFDGSIVHLQQSIDITDSKKAFHDACFDELTNTLTRRAGKELLEKLIKTAHQNCHGFITCMFDINSLKQVNDNYGHSEGDKLIITICQTVKKYLGSGDIFFRLSGDEFIVIFTEHSLQNVKEILQKVLIELKNSAQKNALPYEPSFTYGLLEVQPTSNYSLTDILNRVDEKMYEQKRSYHILKRQQEAGLSKQSDPSEKNNFSYQAQYLYDALVNSTDDYLYVCDVQSDVFHYPKTMVEEFALPGEYIKNAAAIWGAKVHPYDQSAFLASNQEILDGRANIHNVEYRAQNKEGKWIWVRCRGQMQYNEQGEAILFAGFIKKLGENYK
ncbi:diguanylate cyclase domain-containing protein, partial [Phascolarctobacterium faecium]|uniref:diguanylate cyclase domain-containing protein n=1 Tax=Phascolarctobacterium faecium TaxID=33025 RepID=UPI003FEE4F61